MSVRSRVSREISRLSSEKRITRGELAAAAGLHVNTVQRALGGGANMTLDTAERLSVAVGARLELVVRGEKREE